MIATRSPKRYRVVVLQRGRRPLYVQMAIRPPQPFDVVTRMTPLGLYERKDARALASRIRRSPYWRGVRVKVEEVRETSAPAGHWLEREAA